MSQGPAAPAYGFFTAKLDSTIGGTSVPAGTPVYVGSNGNLFLAEANDGTAALACGLLSEPGQVGSEAVVQFAGNLTLTASQWDAVGGTSTGLVPGDRYYVSSTQAGKLVVTAPSAGGTFVWRIGIAQSPNVMTLSIGGPAPIN